MKIKIIGSGCATCEKLHQMILKLKEDGKIPKNTEIEYSKDINELIEKGIMGSPALLINDKVIKVGMVKNEQELLTLMGL